MIQRLRQTLPCDLKQIDAFSAQVSRWLADNLVGEETFAVVLLLREALTNAMKHGSGLNPANRVRCGLRLAKDRIAIVVADAGAGFDWRTAVNNRAGEDAVSGRGLSIYSAYCSRVRFNQRGNAVVLMRRIKTKINMETHRILKTDEGVKIEMCADLVSSVVPELRTQALEHLRAGAKSVGVDLKACAMVDSAGIGLLIAIHNSLAKSGGRLKLSGVSEDVRGLFRAMRLDQHFDMAD